jgi:hypothetical protein
MAHAPGVRRSIPPFGGAFGRALSIRMGLAMCNFLAFGCGGNVAGNGPADASNVFSDASKNLDAGGTLDAGQSSDVQPTVEDGCTVVLPSDYDQSCAVDSDCIAVGQLGQCPASACDGCLTEAINKSVWSRYETALHQAFATDPPVGICNCPSMVVTCCRHGTCQGVGCFSRADTLPACADAGGTCVPVASCGHPGPQGGCAYSDEMCCVP